MKRRLFLNLHLQAMAFLALSLLPGVNALQAAPAGPQHLKVTYALSGGENDVLDNGQVKLTFHRRTGRFEAQAEADGAMRLYAAAPALRIDGQNAAFMDTGKAQIHHESFTDQIGRGEKLVVYYGIGKSAPPVKYELRMYEDEPWVTATAYVPRGSYELGDLSVVQGKIATPAAFDTRVYINSGTAGGDTGVWPLGVRRWNSTAVSVFYDANEREAIGMGFYTFRRASTSVVSQYLGPDQIGVDASAHYNDYRPTDGGLRTESALLIFRQDPMKILNEWANATVAVVKPKFIHDASTGYLNTWYMYGDQTTQEETLRQAQLLKDSVLPGYGIKIVTTGEWQLQHTKPGDVGDSLGFGEDEVDKGLYPDGIKWLIDRIRALGLQASLGANYAYAAQSSALVRKSVPWIVKDDWSRLNFGYPIDFTNPDAQRWVYGIAHRVTQYKAVEWWSDFNGGPTRGRLSDPKQIMGFEDVRQGLRAIRRAVGPHVMMEPACCEYDYFAFIGIVDRARTGQDMAALGNFDDLEAIARQLAGTYMLHQRFWINNSDPLYVGGRDFVHDYGSGPLPSDASLRDEVRMRLQLQLTSGSFVTIGENMEDFDANRLHLLTLVLPTYGQAAKPLDMFIHTTPQEYDLPIAAKWDKWHVLVLQNWSQEGQEYKVQFADLGLSEARRYLVYRFWDQAYVGEFRGAVALKVGRRTGETYAIREAPTHPWVLSTDMTLTQGAVELRDVRFDQASHELTGVASRHAGAEGHIAVYVPRGYAVRSGSGDYSVEKLSSGATIVRLHLSFKQATAPWNLEFDRVRDETMGDGGRL
jgi:hypothetical protein